VSGGRKPGRYHAGPVAQRVAENLRYLRTAHGWTQVKVLHLLRHDYGYELDSNAVYRFEVGTRRLSPDDLIVFAELYGVSVDKLLTMSASEAVKDVMA